MTRVSGDGEEAAAAMGEEEKQPASGDAKKKQVAAATATTATTATAAALAAGLHSSVPLPRFDGGEGDGNADGDDDGSQPRGMRDHELAFVAGGGYLRYCLHGRNATGVFGWTAKYAQPIDHSAASQFPIRFHRETWGITSLNMLVGWHPPDLL